MDSAYSQSCHQPQKNEHTVAARERSQHGLNPEELSQREARDTARRNLAWAKTLEDEIVQAKGGAKAKGKSGGAQSTSKRRRLLTEMSWDEQWWLQQLWAGHLQSALRAAQANYPRAQAEDFVVPSDDDME